MTMKGFLQALALLALASSFASAYDPSPLQDICVAVENPLHGVFVNGKFCKDPKLATADDFYYSVKYAANTDNPLGSNATSVDVNEVPGLNTLGISASRIDFAPYGENPPHIHPRASELIVVLEGTLLVGFITSDPENRLFTKVLEKGGIFVFPIAHIHFQFNIANTVAVAFTAFGSQYPGEITIANAVFGSHPAINPDYLARAFQLDVATVKSLQAKTWTYV